MTRTRSFPSMSPSTPRHPAEDDQTVVKAQLIKYAALPPPKQFLKKCPEIFDKSLTISAYKPYKIIHASNQLCDLLQAPIEQIEGRSMSILFGPETNQSAIFLAIKKISANVEQISASVPAIKIYGQDQRIHLLKARCSVLTNNEVTQQIVLNFESIDYCAIKGIIDSQKEDINLRRAIRSRYNFMTGLELHLEHFNVPDRNGEKQYTAPSVLAQNCQ